MRANRNHKKQRQMDERAQVGIGTMIVFIATVLVAAIAAGVLIDTSGKLQERSSRTGNEATDQVSSNLGVDSIIGKRGASDAGLQTLELYVSLEPGASAMDLAQLRIQLSDGSDLDTLSHVDGAASATAFNVTAERDADSSFSSAAPVINSGDLVKITVDLTAVSGIGQEWQPRTDATIVLMPEVGNKVTIGLSTPQSYATDTVIQLR